MEEESPRGNSSNSSSSSSFSSCWSEPCDSNNTIVSGNDVVDAATAAAAAGTGNLGKRKDSAATNKKYNHEKRRGKSQQRLDHLRQRVSELMTVFGERGWFIPLPESSSSSSSKFQADQQQQLQLQEKNTKKKKVGGRVWSNRMYSKDKKRQRKATEKVALLQRIEQLEECLQERQQQAQQMHRRQQQPQPITGSSKHRSTAAIITRAQQPFCILIAFWLFLSTLIYSMAVVQGFLLLAHPPRVPLLSTKTTQRIPAAAAASSSWSDDNDDDDDDQENIIIQEFEEWIFNKTDCQGRDKVEIRYDGRRRGVFCRIDAKEDDILFAIPLDQCLVVENDETTDAERGMKLMQLMQDHDHDWEPYWNLLPTRGGGDDDGNNNNNNGGRRRHFDATPDFWSNGQIGKLELPLLVQMTMEKKQRIQALALAQQQQQEGKDKKKMPSIDNIVADLQFAAWLVESRGFTLLREPYEDCSEDELESTSILVPFVDMINHSSDHANCELDVLMSDDGMQPFYAVVATGSIPKGHEIMCSYGSMEESSAELLYHHGFVPESNLRNDVNYLLEMNYPNKEEGQEEGIPGVGVGGSSGLNDYGSTQWSSSFKYDIKKLLVEKDPIERTILQFRVRMKEAAWELQQSGKAE